jgi:hypothetical protein
MTTFKRTGTLSGTDTLDTIEFTVDLPATITYTVTAKGEGDNELRVRTGQRVILIWAQIHDFSIEPGHAQTKSFSTDLDLTTPTTDRKQDVRIRLSRKILTKEIQWELSWTVT